MCWWVLQLLWQGCPPLTLLLVLLVYLKGLRPLALLLQLKALTLLVLLLLHQGQLLLTLLLPLHGLPLAVLMQLQGLLPLVSGPCLPPLSDLQLQLRISAPALGAESGAASGQKPGSWLLLLTLPLFGVPTHCRLASILCGYSLQRQRCSLLVYTRLLW
jgi:hypothetical protein